MAKFIPNIKIQRHQLKPGDHIFVKRSYGLHMHHGIYTGSEVIHFIGIISKPSTPCIKASKKSDGNLMKASTLDEFQNGLQLYLVQYGKESGYMKSEPNSVVCETALQVLSLCRLHVFDNTLFKNCREFIISCEKFATACKTQKINYTKDKPLHVKMETGPLTPGDHIYVYRPSCPYHLHHGIFTGELFDQVIQLSETECNSNSTQGTAIIVTTLEMFVQNNQLRVAKYGVPFNETVFKRAGTLHTTQSRPTCDVIATAKEYLLNPSQTFKCCEDFAKFCKTGGKPQEEDDDDSKDRVRFLSHSVHRDELKPGDHIYVYRMFFAYQHHGIYTGNTGKEVIHFARTDESQPIATATVQEATLGKFLDGGQLRLVAYGEDQVITDCKKRGTSHSYRSRPASEVVALAGYFAKNPQYWGEYNLIHNNCEDFATYCKTRDKKMIRAETQTKFLNQF